MGNNLFENPRCTWLIESLFALAALCYLFFLLSGPLSAAAVSLRLLLGYGIISGLLFALQGKWRLSGANMLLSLLFFLLFFI